MASMITFPTFPEKMDIKVSSKRRGRSKAPENGQPRMDPTPNHMMPSATLCFPRLSKNAVRPNMDVYIAKLDGKYAADAWKNPGLTATIIKNRTPIRGLSVREMAEYSRVSHAAQMNASAKRMV
jgi:hypothetical protein